MTTDHEKKYPPETAGRLMTDKVPVVHDTATVVDVERLLIDKAADFETINYIFITDSQNKLKGVLSIKELFRTKKEISVSELLQQEVVSIRAYSDQERVALLALKHNIKTVPVVDKENTFLGAVPADAILRILDREAVEDILRLGGIYHRGSFDDLLKMPIFTSLKHRLPWLVLGLLGGIAAAGIVGRFEDVLTHNIILAAFIPLIVYMADAVGTQMEAFIIRDFAVNPKIAFNKYFLRQFTVISLIAIITSIVLFVLSLVLYSNPRVSFVLALALFFAVISSVFTGLIVPYLFGKARLDPANASGPIATIIQDVLSVLVYFTVAGLLL